MAKTKEPKKSDLVEALEAAGQSAKFDNVVVVETKTTITVTGTPRIGAVSATVSKLDKTGKNEAPLGDVVENAVNALKSAWNDRKPSIGASHQKNLP